MSSIDKSIVSILEGDIESMDYGVPEFNKLFKGLDSKTKKKLIKDFPPDKPDNKDIHVGVLKNIRDPEIQEVWNELSQEERDNLDKKNIRDKYLTLRHMINQKNKKPIRPPSSSSEEKFESSSPLSESTKTKIAIIIPFRDMEKEKKRTKELNNLVEYFATYLKGDEYKIFLVEQSNDGRKFNRGQLLNIGFEYAVKEGYNNFIFHDVDLLPSEELKEYYENIPQDKPVHIAAVWDRYGGNPKYFGGIVAFNKKMFERINGYPNDFWGWGGEDDELYKRTKKFYDILKVKKGSIRDLEKLSLEEKLDYLRENDLKFMQKNEALAKHDSTWKKNGINTLNYKEINVDSCGERCEKIEVELNNVGNVVFVGEEKEEVFSNVPKEILHEDEELEAPKKQSQKSQQERFNDLVKIYYNTNPFIIGTINHELEVKFGTKGIKQLTRNDYDNVIKKLKSSEFSIIGDSSGVYNLRVNCEFLDSVTGRFKLSDVRTEIKGLHNIQTYCGTNDIKSLYKECKKTYLLSISLITFINGCNFIISD
jgi:hypothetical protein